MTSLEIGQAFQHISYKITDDKLLMEAKPYFDKLEKEIIRLKELERTKQCTWVKNGEYLHAECTFYPRSPYFFGISSYKHCPYCGDKLGIFDTETKTIIKGDKDKVSSFVKKRVLEMGVAELEDFDD